MKLQINERTDYDEKMNLSRNVFLGWILLSVLLAFPTFQLSAQTKEKKTKFDDLIERFSPDLNIQAKQQQRRLDGFYEHSEEGKRFDRIRERGETEYNEGLLKWEDERSYVVREYRKDKLRNMNKVDREAERDKKEFEKQNQKFEADFNKNRKGYVTAREKIKEQSRRKFSEEEELSIYHERPRYEDRKRALYGARTKWTGSGKPSTGSSGSSGGGMSSPSYDDTSPPPPPPPSPVDTGNMDYFPPPPPPPPMDDYNVPPPPPMDDFGSPMQGDYGAPPPPPPDFNQGY